MRLIDADALMVHHGMNVGRNYGGLRAVVFKRDIDNAPTVDAVPVVHGHWVEREEDGDRIVHCSECFDEYTEDLELASWVKHYFKFCPNCGAKMDEEEDYADNR